MKSNISFGYLVITDEGEYISPTSLSTVFYATRARAIAALSRRKKVKGRVVFCRLSLVRDIKEENGRYK